MSMTREVLTIAASDPSGGAGIESDLKVMSAHGVYGLTAITAITIQDSAEVRGIEPVPVDTFKRVLEVLRLDREIAAIKLGALATDDHLQAVAEFLDKLDPRPPVVADPVFRATSGAWLLAMNAVSKYEDAILKRCDMVTPNLIEAGVLLKRPVRDLKTMREAALELARKGPSSVLIKGGHMRRDSRDVFAEAGEIVEHENDRLPHEFHGTGCALSSAIASRLALGHEPGKAVEGARAYLRLAMQRARKGTGDSYILDFPPARDLD